MQHITGSSAAVHEWRGITIRELTPPGADWSGSLVEVDVPASIRHPVARSMKCGTFYYCDYGELEFEVGAQKFLVSAGDLVVIEPGEWYSYRNDSASQVRLLSFNVPAYDPSGTEVQEPAGPVNGHG